MHRFFRHYPSRKSLKNSKERGYGLEYNRNKAGTVLSTELYFPSKSKFFFEIVNEGRLARFFKRFGLAQELQIGDAQFDKEVYFGADHPDLTRLITNNESLQNNIRKIKRKWASVRGDGLGGIRFIAFGKVEPDDDDIKDISEFNQVLEQTQTRSARDPFYLKIILLEVFMFLVGGYGIGAYLELTWNDTRSLLEVGTLVTNGIICGLILFGLWCFGLLFLLRRSAHGPLLAAELGILGFIGLLAAGPQAFVDINKMFDSSVTQEFTALVEQKYSRTTGSGKNRRTRYYLVLTFNENPLRIPSPFLISSWDYNRFTERQGIRFFVKQGALKAAYIDEIQSTALPETWRVESAKVSQQRMNEIREALKWRAEKPSENVAAQRRIEKYRTGQVRSDEPLVNGMIHGVARYYHENGVPYAEIPFLNGEKHGSFKLFRADGTIEQNLSYKNGKPHGLLQWHDSQGNLIQREVYIEGSHVPLEAQVLLDLLQE